MFNMFSAIPSDAEKETLIISIIYAKYNPSLSIEILKRNQRRTMEQNLLGRVSLITGASTGIGRAAALSLARRGSHVVINYNKNRKEALETEKKARCFGVKTLVVRANVGKEKDVKEMVKKAVKEFKKIDILINNAGGPVKRSSFLKCTEKVWDEVMALNLKGTFLCSREVLQQMVKQKTGKVVNISSVAAFHGSPGESVHYAASKGGVHSLTIGLSKEFASYNITVNAIAPGLINTPFHEKFSTPERVKRIISNIPISRIGTPEEVAELICFLASDAGNYITGEVIRISGGR